MLALCNVYLHILAEFAWKRSIISGVPRLNAGTRRQAAPIGYCRSTARCDRSYVYLPLLSCTNADSSGWIAPSAAESHQFAIEWKDQRGNARLWGRIGDPLHEVVRLPWV